MQIQMVGRLIKKQDVRLGKEKLTKGNTGSLTSGKGSDRLVKVFRRKTKSLQDSGNLTFISIAVFPFKPESQIVIGRKLIFQSSST